MKAWVIEKDGKYWCGASRYSLAVGRAVAMPRCLLDYVILCGERAVPVEVTVRLVKPRRKK